MLLVLALYKLSYRSNLLEQCLPLIAADLEGAEFEGAEGPDDEVRFAYGTIAKKEEKGKKGEKKEAGEEILLTMLLTATNVWRYRPVCPSAL
mgnify:CR=1 FL=1